MFTRCVAILIMGIALAACTSVKFDIKPTKKGIAPIIQEFVNKKDADDKPVADEKWTRKVTYHNKSKEREYGQVVISFGKKAALDPVIIDIRRSQSRGYIAETTFYKEDKLSTSFGFSYNKEHKFMLGFHVTLKF